MTSELHPKLVEGGHHALARLVDKHLAEHPKPRLKPGDWDVLRPNKRLDCMGCVAACCHIAGYVEISMADAQRLADCLGMTLGQFLDVRTEAYDGSRIIRKFRGVPVLGSGPPLYGLHSPPGDLAGLLVLA